MKTSPIAGTALVLGTAVMLAGCALNELPPTPAPGGGSTASLSGTIQGVGATSMKAAQETWVAEFQLANPGVTVNYKPDGSGAGREGFIAGAAQFAGSDRALNDEELAAGGFAGCAADSTAWNLPVFIVPIAIIFNVAGVTDLTLDPATAAGIFAGRITNWNDPAIAATNPGVALPDLPIPAVHRSDDSGTTENFTATLAGLAPEVWTWEADGEWPSSLGGEAAQGTSGVVQAVTQGTGAIGYADAAQAGLLGKASVLIAGTSQRPTAEGAAAVVDASPRIEGRSEHDLAVDIDRTAEGVYPFVLVSYALVCQTYADPATAELVKAYVGYTASVEGQVSAAAAAGSAPLSPALTAAVAASVDAIS